MSAPPRPPRSRRDPSPRSPDLRRRRRRALVLAFAALLVVVLVAVTAGGSGDEERRGGESGRSPTALLPGSAPGEGVDPLRHTAALQDEHEARAAAGLAHVLYTKSPGGAVVTARRVDALRPQIERAAAVGGVDPAVLEAMVYLESAGRPDAIADPRDLNSAAGLTQILAETGINLLGMRIEVGPSARLTRGIARGSAVARRTKRRRQRDERFDPDKALAATVRYLTIARRAFADNDDSAALAVASYHMGIGNLQTALTRFGDEGASYAELYFGSSPVNHPSAYAFLRDLGDDSATYLWRVRAAEAIMRRYRSDPVGLASEAVRHSNKSSAEEALRPAATTTVFADPAALERARSNGSLVALDPQQLTRYGISLSTTMGELAPRLDQSRRLYRALRPEALAVLLYLGAAAQGISGGAPLILTSTVRDERYQELLTTANIEATRNYSLHTTGYAFDILRKYVGDDQRQAFQFALDRLTALDVIAWVREPAAIHITAGPRARDLLPLVREDAPVPAPPLPGGAG